MFPYGTTRVLTATCLIMNSVPHDNATFTTAYHQTYVKGNRSSTILRRLIATINVSNILLIGRNASMISKRTWHLQLTLSKSSTFLRLKVRTLCLIRTSTTWIKGLLRVGIATCLRHVNYFQGINFRKTSIILTMMNRCMINNGRNKRMTTYLFKRVIMSFPVVNFPSQTTSNFISNTQATIMNNGRRIPIFMGIVRILRMTYYHPNHLCQIATFICRTITFRSMCLSNNRRGLPWSTNSHTKCNEEIRDKFCSKRMFRLRQRTMNVRHFFRSKRVRITNTRRRNGLITRASNVRISRLTRGLIM